MKYGTCKLLNEVANWILVLEKDLICFLFKQLMPEMHMLSRHLMAKS